MGYEAEEALVAAEFYRRLIADFKDGTLDSTADNASAIHERMEGLPASVLRAIAAESLTSTCLADGLAREVMAGSGWVNAQRDLIDVVMTGVKPPYKSVNEAGLKAVLDALESGDLSIQDLAVAAVSLVSSVAGLNAAATSPTERRDGVLSMARDNRKGPPPPPPSAVSDDTVEAALSGHAFAMRVCVEGGLRVLVDGKAMTTATLAPGGVYEPSRVEVYRPC